MNPTITGSQCRAARALVEWSAAYLASVSKVDADLITAFERHTASLDDDQKLRIMNALEAGGAVFIAENGGGAGVRLKFNSKEVRAINKWEGEGGSVGEDDV